MQSEGQNCDLYDHFRGCQLSNWLHVKNLQMNHVSISLPNAGVLHVCRKFPPCRGRQVVENGKVLDSHIKRALNFSRARRKYKKVSRYAVQLKCHLMSFAPRQSQFLASYTRALLIPCRRASDGRSCCVAPSLTSEFIDIMVDCIRKFSWVFVCRYTNVDRIE